MKSRNILQFTQQHQQQKTDPVNSTVVCAGKSKRDRTKNLIILQRNIKLADIKKHNSWTLLYCIVYNANASRHLMHSDKTILLWLYSVLCSFLKLMHRYNVLPDVLHFVYAPLASLKLLDWNVECIEQNTLLKSI